MARKQFTYTDDGGNPVTEDVSVQGKEWGGLAVVGNIKDPNGRASTQPRDEGWVAEIPEGAEHNFQFRREDLFLSELEEQGIAQWSALTNYPAGGSAKGSDGGWYKALVPSGPGTSVVDPVGNPTEWLDMFSAINTLFNDSNVPFVADNVQVAIEKARQETSILINGNFAINQEVVSGSVVLSPGQYGHDGFKAGVGGCSYTFSKLLNKTIVTITAGSLLQIADGDKIQSRSYVLSSEGTSQAQIDGGGFAATPITATLVGGTHASIEFGIGTLSLVQMIPGLSVKEFIFLDEDEDLFKCQWYYEDSFPGGNGSCITAPLAINVGDASSDEFVGATFNTPKRTTPIVTLRDRNGNAGQINRWSSGAATALVSAISVNTDRIKRVTTTTSVTWSGEYHLKADSRL